MFLISIIVSNPNRLIKLMQEQYIIKIGAFIFLFQLEIESQNILALILCRVKICSFITFTTFLLINIQKKGYSVYIIALKWKKLMKLYYYNMRPRNLIPSSFPPKFACPHLYSFSFNIYLCLIIINIHKSCISSSHRIYFSQSQIPMYILYTLIQFCTCSIFQGLAIQTYKLNAHLV